MRPKTMTALSVALVAAAVGVQSVRDTPDYRREMRSYKMAHPTCEHAYNTNVVHYSRCAVHHRIPVHVRPDLATNQSKFITLCDPLLRRDGCHFRCGHLGNWKTENTNASVCVRSALQSRKEGVTK